jgi:hypothetical protein
MAPPRIRPTPRRFATLQLHCEQPPQPSPDIGFRGKVATGGTGGASLLRFHGKAAGGGTGGAQLEDDVLGFAAGGLADDELGFAGTATTDDELADDDFAFAGNATTFR